MTIEQALKGNKYPGRGIAMGINEDGTKIFSAYFIMGRSANSRNRRLIEKDGDIFTDFAVKDESCNPELVIYRAITELDNKIIITNGDQTDTICDCLKDGKTYRLALNTREFEPDLPNFTPRISGMITILGSIYNDIKFDISILKAIPSDIIESEEVSDELCGCSSLHITDSKKYVDKKCVRMYWDYKGADYESSSTIKKGRAILIHTYLTDGNPIPAYKGNPKSIEVPNTLKEWGDTIWSSLDEDNKVALCVKEIDIKTNKSATKFYNKL